MIGLYILLALITVVSLLIFSSICIKFSFDEEILVRASFLGVELFKLDSSVKDKPSKEKKSHKCKDKDKDKEKDKGRLMECVKNYARSKNIFSLISDVFSVLLVILKKLKDTVGHLRFYDINFDLTVASPDAAETAILYGKMCSVISPVAAILNGNFRFDCESISVKTDFLSDKTTLKASGTVKLRVVHIVSLALTSAWAILKIKIGEIKYVRK